MTKYRKKPIIVDAVKYLGSGNNEGGAPPDWMWEAFKKEILLPTNGADPLIVKTLEGDMTVNPGDYIIRGIQGELYPCKPDIFEQTYETLNEEEDHD